jgi:hypothetical protein
MILSLLYVGQMKFASVIIQSLLVGVWDYMEYEKVLKIILALPLKLLRSLLYFLAESA